MAALGGLAIGAASVVAPLIAKGAVSAAGGRLFNELLARVSVPHLEDLRKQLELAAGVIVKIQDYGVHSDVVNGFFDKIAESLDYLDGNSRPDPTKIADIRATLHDYVGLLTMENSVLCSNVCRNKEEIPAVVVPELMEFNFALLDERVKITTDNAFILSRGEFQGKSVFIKALQTTYADSIDRINFKREALVLKLLESFTGVVRFYGVDNNTNPTQMVYESGRCSLRDYLPKLMDVPLLAKVKLLIECCRTFAYLCKYNIYHRDIKPENILIMDDNSVKVMNFGLVKAPVSQSNAGTKKGTPVYMAPEILLHTAADVPHPYSEASDMYSFAIMMNEVLTDSQAPPMDLAVHTNLMSQSNSKTRPSLLSSSQYPDNTDECAVLIHFIKCCWHVDPKVRYSFVLLHTNLRVLFNLH